MDYPQTSKKKNQFSPPPPPFLEEGGGGGASPKFLVWLPWMKNFTTVFKRLLLKADNFKNVKRKKQKWGEGWWGGCNNLPSRLEGEE